MKDFFFEQHVRVNSNVERSLLPKQEKVTFQDMYPLGKYSLYPDIDKEEWKKLKYDFRDKFRYYQSLIPRGTAGTSVIHFSEGEKDGMAVKFYEPVIENPLITDNFPRILSSYRVLNSLNSEEEEVISDLYEQAKQKNPQLKVFEVADFVQLEKILIGEYMVGNSTLIDTERLKSDLYGGKLFFNFYEEDHTPAAQASEFKSMNKFLLEPQQDEGERIVPYNRYRAIFMVLYYMRHNCACISFLKSMQAILGNFDGMVKIEELVLPPLKNNQIEKNHLISQTTADRKLREFPTLLDMKLCSYKFVIANMGDSFCEIQSKTLYVNRVTYYTFNEHFDGLEDSFINYRHTMIYALKLIVPDEENFSMARSIGLVDSRKIDWQFWKDNVIKYEFPPALEQFLLEEQYLHLLKMKKKYYNFYINLATDYYRKSVYEPVSLVFNVATIIFALAGVIQIFQQANIIPAMA